MTQPKLYFYHNFPRRPGLNKERRIERGLEVLDSMARLGFVLTPRVHRYYQILRDGSRGNPVENLETTLCLTCIPKSELKAHSKIFGEFAIEFNATATDELGLFPAIYIPPSPVLTAQGTSITEAMSGLFMKTFADINDVLVYVHEHQPDLIRFRQENVNFKTLSDNLQGFIRLVTPTGKTNKQLAYYHQNEWRIPSSFKNYMTNKINTRIITESEKRELSRISSFFKKGKFTVNGQVCNVRDNCYILQNLSVDHVLKLSSGVYVPGSAKSRAKDILMRHNLGDVPVKTSPTD